MITRGSAYPGWDHTPGLPPPLHAVHPDDRVPCPGRAGVPAGGAAALLLPAAPQAAGGPRGASAAPRGGLLGGAVVFTGTASTPGGSAGYGYLGMDITDPASWPRPYNPVPTAAWFCYRQEAR